MLSHRLIILLACVALIGGVAGYGIAYYQFEVQAVPEEAHLELDHSNPAEEPSGSQNAAVVVQFYGGNEKVIRQAAGVWITNPETSNPMLLMAVENFYGTDRADVIVDGQRYALDDVVALHADAGLVLMTSQQAGQPTLMISADTALYLGQDIEAVSPFEKITGMVDSPAQYFVGDYFSYAVKLNAALSSEFAALLDPESRKMIGLIIKGGENELDYVAIDTSLINTLIDHVGKTPVQSVAQFSQRFFQDTVQGLVVKIQYAAAKGDWEAVADFGKALSRDDLINQDEISTQLDYAYMYVARKVAEAADIKKALSVLDEADQLLGISLGRNTLRAKILSDAGRTMESIAVLGRSVDQGVADEGSYIMLRSLVLAAINSGKLADEAVIELLNQSIARDAEFAVYHEKLGRQLYSQGRYAEALSSFNFALQLNPAFFAELNSLMKIARQRRDLPGQIIVPLHAYGSNIVVDVAINRTHKRFVLDTGASVTALSADVAEEIGLRGFSTEFATLSTANGMVRAPLVMIESVSLEDAIVRNMKVAILSNLGQIDGLLGLDFLNHFDIDIDQEAGEMTLRKR